MLAVVGVEARLRLMVQVELVVAVLALIQVILPQVRVQPTQVAAVVGMVVVVLLRVVPVATVAPVLSS
jgi:hypothetical protein